jgi:peroxiredoxin
MANLNIDDKWIDFSLPGVDDKTHSLSDYGDKEAIAIVFSCNHCPYVRAWEDRMVQIQRDYMEKGVQLIAINSNDTKKYPEDSFDHMKKRAKDKDFNFPYLRDESQEIASKYGAEHTPEVFLFDRSGILRYHGAIDDNYDNPKAVKKHYLRDALEAVLSGKTPPVRRTPPVGCTIKWK